MMIPIQRDVYLAVEPKAGVGDIDSVILSDALRQLDFRERSMEFIVKCPRDIL